MTQTEKVRPDHAAMFALGISSDDSNHQIVTRFREALDSGHHAPFEIVQTTFTTPVCAGAALELAREFGGRVTPASGGERRDHGGVFRRGDRSLFHPDSNDIEDELALRLREGRRRGGELLIDLDVPIGSAREVIPLGTPYKALLTGSVIDFARLHRRVAPKTSPFHPDTVAAATECFEEFRVYRNLWAAIQESKL